MPIITKSMLDAALNPTRESDEASSKMSYQNQGPGRLDTWLRFMEDNSNCWQKREHLPLSAKKKIIFCNTLLREYAPDTWDLALISALIEHYEVYLWPGNNKDLPNEPLTSSAEFWEKLPSVPPASPQVVAEGLAALGYATEDYHIIDYFAYNSLLHRCKTHKNPDNKQNQNDDALNHAKLNGAPLEHILAAIDTTRTKNVITSLTTADELEAFLQFPNLEKITFEGLWSDSYLQQLAGHDIHLQIKPENYLKSTIPTSLKGVSLLRHDITFDHANNESNVECLELVCCTTDGYLDLGFFPKLKKLLLLNPRVPVINFPSDLEVLEIDGDITFPQTKSLKNLKISGKSSSPINFSQLPNLETLEIVTPVPLQDLSPCKKLKHLSLTKNVLEETMDFAQFTDLKELTIMTAHQISFGIKNVSKLERLTVNRFLAPPKENISSLLVIENCPNLKYIKLNAPLKKLELSPLPKLEYLQTNYILDMDYLTLNLETCPQLRYLKLPTLPQSMDRHQHLEYLCVFGKWGDLPFSALKSSSLKSLELRQVNLNDFDCSQLPNLENLHIIGFNGIEINLSNCLRLKALDLSSDCLEVLNISKTTNLEELTIAGCENYYEQFNSNNLKELKLTNHIKLKYLSVKGSKVKQIDLSGCQALEALEISICDDLTMLSLQNCRKLKCLKVSGNFDLVKEIPFTQLPELESISITINGSQANPVNLNLNLSQLPKLKTISVSSYQNLQTKLNLRNAIELRQVNIDAQHCNIDVNLANCTKLQTASFKVNQIRMDHLEDCKQLRLFNAVIHKTESIACLKDQLPRDCQFQLIPSTPQQQVHLDNEDSPVSLFSLEEETMGFDANTGQQRPHNALGGLHVTITTADKISRHNYRTLIYDQVGLHKGKLVFTSQKDNCEVVTESLSGFTDQDMAELNSRVHAEPDQALALFKGLLEPGKRYPLTTLQTIANHDDIEVYCQPQNAVRLLWHPKHQQYYVELQGFKAQDVEILYRFKTNPSYELKPAGALVQDHLGFLLPADLAAQLEALRNHQDLQFLFDKNLSLKQKTKSLIQYCHFNQSKQEWASAQDKGDIVNLLTAIKNRTGVCRHSSKAFMLLARCFLGIPVRMVGNELHEFTEIPYRPEDGSYCWRRVDLGGGHVVDQTPKEKRENKFQALPKVVAARDRMSNSPITQQQRLQDVYYREFIALTEKQELPSVESLLQTVLPPAIELNANQEPLKVSEYLHQSLNLSADTPYFYVDSPKDFALETRYIVDGQRQKIATPLANILQTRGIVVVNWDHFNATDIATYKSILEPEPTLSGRSVSKRVHVIGLTKEHTENCTAFSSRCQHYKLPDDFVTKDNVGSIVEMAPVEIDLFHSLNWQEQLLATILPQGDQLLLKEGALIKAIREQRPIIIHNPPADERLKVLLYRVNVERKLFFNGELLSIPEGVTVRTATRENAKSLDNVIIEQETDIREHHNHIFLGLHNFHECFEQLTFTESKQAEIKPGFLAEPAPVFYVTECIPLSDWQALLAYIKEIYPQKTFKFILAPGVSIQQVAQNQAPASCLTLEAGTPLSDMPTVMASNDRDYLCEQLAKQAEVNGQEVEVFHLSPNASFSQMVAEMKITEQPDSNKSDFIYQEQAVLQALRKGKTVILNGELTPGFYQALLPLLSNYG
jgi:hypothetical protein